MSTQAELRLRPLEPRALPLSERWLYQAAPSLPRAVLQSVWNEVFGALLHVRRSCLSAAEAPCVPVLSIGSLMVGGAGKTAVTAYIAEHLLRAGCCTAILSRGYGRSARGPRIVAPSAAMAEAAELGDEPAMLLTELRARGLAPALGVGRDRAKVLAQLLATGVRPDAVLLDDGFQHRRLGRHMDILVMPSTLPNNTLFPLGPLREALGRVWDAELLWLHGGDGQWPCVRGLAGRRAELISRYVLEQQALPPAFTLLCGVGRNANVLSLLELNGLRPETCELLRDHAGVHRGCIQRLRRQGLPVLLTAKDESRFGNALREAGLDLQVLSVRLEFAEGEQLLHRRLATLVERGESEKSSAEAARDR